jgi:hypothetical protein
MEFVRQIVNGNTLKPILTLPPSFYDVQVEIIVLPVDNKQLLTASSLSADPNVSTNPVKHSAFGRLNAYANPSLIPEEKGAWEKEAAEKYALH